jgi:hypothetical protein
MHALSNQKNQISFDESCPTNLLPILFCTSRVDNKCIQKLEDCTFYSIQWPLLELLESGRNPDRDHKKKIVEIESQDFFVNPKILISHEFRISKFTYYIPRNLLLLIVF